MPQAHKASVGHPRLDSFGSIPMHCLTGIIQSIGWEGLTALSTLLLAIVAIVAAFYAKNQLEESRREDRIKHLIDLVSEFEREPMAGFRQRLAAARVEKNGKLRHLDLSDPPYELHDVMNFFEHMGYLLDGGYLDLAGVSTEFHYWIFRIWADARELVKHERSEAAVYYEYFEKMERRLEDFEQEQGREFRLPTSEELEVFYAEESRLPAGSPIPRQRRKINRDEK